MHGLIIHEITRDELRSRAFDGYVRDYRPADRQKAFARGMFKTANTEGFVNVALTEAEIKIINKLEQKIAERVAIEIASEGAES